MRKITRISSACASIPQRKRVAAYARVSADEDDNIMSLGAQVDHFSKAIRSNPGWAFAGVFADEGITGTRGDRPGFIRLLAACEAGRIDIVLTKSVSRFARNTVLLLSTIRRLKELGVGVRFEREGVDTMSGDGELLLTLLASFAEAESVSISGNTRWAIRKGFEKGIDHNRSPMLGYRWDGEEFTVVPEEAGIVRLIFRSHLDGSTPDRIAMALNAQGARTVKGCAFSSSSVAIILRQEKYAGSSVLQKTFVADPLTHRWARNRGELPMYIAEGTHPAIISRQDFDSVQREIGVRRALGFRANRKVPFSFLTSHVVCGRCGKTYRRKTIYSPGGKRYRRWVCSTKIDRGAGSCHACDLPEPALLSMLGDALGLLEVTAEAFSDRVERVVVDEFSIGIVMKDGRIERREWKDGSTNRKAERRNGHAEG